MKLNLISKIGIVIASILLGLYLIFLILPFIITPIVKNYIPVVNEEIKKMTGLVSEIEDFRIITTPKLTAGAKLGNLTVSTPQNKEIFEMDNLEIKLSLLPILRKRIELDLIKVDDIDINLGVNKDGSFEI